mgnify:CR=1 FL=1
MIDKSKISRERLLYLKKKRNSKIFVIFMRVFILCAFFVLWEILARTGVIDSFLSSSPSRIFKTLKSLLVSGELWIHVGTTVYETVKKNTCSEADKAAYDKLLKDIADLPKYGNDVKEVDEFAREIAYVYTKEIEKYSNPRGGRYQAGLYPVSANVPLGAQTGATPDGREAGKPFAPGANPMHNRGPTREW